MNRLLQVHRSHQYTFLSVLQFPNVFTIYMSQANSIIILLYFETQVFINMPILMLHMQGGLGWLFIS